MKKSEPDSDKNSAYPSLSVPEALLGGNRWICWRYEQVGGEDKKPPYDPKTGEYASINESNTWGDFETALGAYQSGDYDGIGYVLTEEDSITGFDFDDCRDPKTGEIEPEIEDIIERLDSYSEISPSGTGIHTLIVGEKPEEYGSKGGAYIEVYDSARYFTFTGDHLDGTPESIESREDELQRICEVYLNQTSTVEVEESGTPNIDTDDDLIEMGEKALHDLQEESTLVFRDVMDFLQGGISEFDRTELLKEDGLIDVSGQEYIGISLLYSTVKRYLDDSESKTKEITWVTWTHYCREHPTTRHSQKRRWLTDTDKYRSEIFNHAISMADGEKFEMMVEEKKAGTRRENNEYSKMTYGALWDALSELTPTIEKAEKLLASSPQPYNDMDPENPQTESRTPVGHRAGENPELHELYPSKSEVIDRAYEIDDEYNEWGTYEEAFRRLQSDFGQVKAARIGQTTWVFYAVGYPDPPEACYIKLKGQKLEPEKPYLMQSFETSEESEESEPELMTDGGQPMSEESRESTERKSEQAQSDSREQAIDSSSEGQNRPRANSESNEGDGDDSVGKPPPMTPHM